MNCFGRRAKESRVHEGGRESVSPSANTMQASTDESPLSVDGIGAELSGVVVVDGVKYQVEVSTSDGGNDGSFLIYKHVLDKVKKCKEMADAKKQDRNISDTKHRVISNLSIIIENTYSSIEKLIANTKSIPEENHKQLQLLVHRVNNICTTLHEALSKRTSIFWDLIKPCGAPNSLNLLRKLSSDMHKASVGLWEIQRCPSTEESLSGKYQLRKANSLPEHLVGPVGSQGKNQVCWWTKTGNFMIFSIDNEEYRVILPEIRISDVTCLLIGDFCLWTGHRDGSIFCWCTETCSVLQYSKRALSSQPCVMVEDENSHLWIGTCDGELYGVTVSGSNNQKIGKIGSNHGKFMIRYRINGHSSRIVSLVSTTNIIWSASNGDAGYCIKCWDAVQGTLISQLYAENECLKQLVFHEREMDQLFLIGALKSGRVHVWNVVNPRLGIGKNRVTIQGTRGMGNLLSAFMIGEKFCQAYSTGVLLFWPEGKVTHPQKLAPPCKLIAHKGGMANACKVGGRGAQSLLTTSCKGAIVYWTMQEINLLLAVPESMHGESQLKEFELAIQEQIGQNFDAGMIAKTCPSTVFLNDASFYRVRLLKVVGEGGYGKVYSAKWGVVDVAVKLLMPQNRTQPNCKDGTEYPLQLVHRMGTEAFFMGSLRHPNVLLFLGYSTYPPCIITEFCARGSLYEVLHKIYRNVLSDRLRLYIALGAAAGMAYLHNQTPPILHRDLKSTNILIDRDWTPKIADFGLSTMLIGSKHESACGVHSPQWAAPEVLGGGIYSKASDVYSFGVILWEIFTMKRPWNKLSPWQVMHAVIVEDARPGRSDDCLEQTDSEVAGRLKPLIERCWATTPEDRPSFCDVCQELEVAMHLLKSREKEEIS